MDKALQHWLAGLLMMVGLCGCQCCALTDHYFDVIDCVATKEPALDPLYHPGLDLTRIGRSDWCQCRINRALCPCACARCKPLPHIPEPPTGYPPAASPIWRPARAPASEEILEEEVNRSLRDELQPLPRLQPPIGDRPTDEVPSQPLVP